MKTRKGIRRVDCEQNRTKGWYVTIRRTSGEVVRLFSDGVFGGKLASYRAASAWFSETLPSYPLMPRTDRVSIVRRNNRSGVAGVFRWPADGNDTQGAYWGVQWVAVPGQRPIRRKFSIALYGELKAKNLAIQVRKEAMQQLGVESAMV